MGLIQLEVELNKQCWGFRRRTNQRLTLHSRFEHSPSVRTSISQEAGPAGHIRLRRKSRMQQRYGRKSKRAFK